MTRRRRFLKIAKWTATVMFVLSLAAWVFAVVVRLQARIGSVHVLSIEDGAIWYGRFAPLSGPNFTISLSPFWEFGLDTCFESIALPRGRSFSGLHLWFPTSLLVVVATALYIIDRRRIPPGHCRKCGYNLTGNTSGRCPECGAEIAGVKS